MSEKKLVWFDIDKAIFDAEKANEANYFSDESIAGFQMTKIYFYTEKRKHAQHDFEQDFLN